MKPHNIMKNSDIKYLDIFFSPIQINQLDFDVVSIECSRSGGEIIEAFVKIDFKRQIGL